MRQLLAPRFVTTILLLSATLAGSILSERRKPDSLAFPLQKLNSDIMGWHSERDEELSANILARLAPTSYLSRRYQKGNTELDIFIAYYAQQRAGEAMHSPKYCLPGAGWEIWKHGSEMVTVGDRQVRVNKYSIANVGQRKVMFYWYQGKDRIVASEYMVKILLVRDSLFNGYTAGSIVRVVLPDAPEFSQEGVAFCSSLISEVDRCFGGQLRQRKFTGSLPAGRHLSKS
jgi:EpsI family protein